MSNRIVNKFKSAIDGLGYTLAAAAGTIAVVQDNPEMAVTFAPVAQAIVQFLKIPTEDTDEGDMLHKLVIRAMESAIEEARKIEPFELPESTKDALKREIFSETKTLSLMDSPEPHEVLSQIIDSILDSCEDCVKEQIPISDIAEAMYRSIEDGIRNDHELQARLNGLRLETIAVDTKHILKLMDIGEQMPTLNDKIKSTFIVENKLPQDMISSIISQIKTIESMATVRKLLIAHTAELSEEIFDFGINYIAENNCAELRKLCQDLIFQDRTDEIIFEKSLQKLSKYSQSELYKVFEKLHLQDSPIFTQYFDDITLFTDKKLKLQFITTYLPDVQETLAELPLDFEQIIINCNSSLRVAQNKVRVYSWDELDFNSVYVAPFLNDKPNKDEETYFSRSETTNSNKRQATETIAEASNYDDEDRIVVKNILSDVDDYRNSKTVESDQSAATGLSKGLLESKHTAHSELDFISLRGPIYTSIFGTGERPFTGIVNEIDDIYEHTRMLISSYFSLDSTFVDSSGFSDELFASAIRERSIEERNERINSIFRDDDIVYVVGGAGYGKSLFLKKLATSPSIILGFQDKPRLIIRGDIKRMINTDGTFKPIIEYLDECFVNGSLKRTEEVHSDFLVKCLRAGRCLVLLDALDEVGNDQRNELHGLIVSYFQKNYPNNKVCITSRERGFIPRENITCFYITPITIGHIEEYVDNFIKLGIFDEDEKTRFTEQSTILVNKGFIKGFLTLSLLMAIYKNEHELPANKVLLYEKCFEYIANTREKSKRLMLNSSSGEEYDWAVLTKIMNDATFMELTQIGVPNNADIPRYKVEDLMLSLYEKRFHSSTECKMATNMFLQFCSDRTEIFVPSPNSNMDYRFYHRSFYEYFCAKHIEAQTTDVPSTYKALCKFDIDSEVIELLLSLYERRNPRYLRALVSYVFEDVEKSITDRISHDFSEMMEVLILIMQNVDETDFYERFVDLVLSISVSTTDLNILTEYRLIVNALKHNEQYFMKQFNLNRDEYLTRIRDVLADRIIQKKGKLLELMKKKNKNKSFTIDDICSNKGLECQWLLALLPDFDDILQSFFDVFADPKKVAMIRKGTRQGRSDLKSFADKVNALPYKERKRIYMASLLV